MILVNVIKTFAWIVTYRIIVNKFVLYRLSFSACVSHLV